MTTFVALADWPLLCPNTEKLRLSRAPRLVMYSWAEILNGTLCAAKHTQIIAVKVLLLVLLVLLVFLKSQRTLKLM